MRSAALLVAIAACGGGGGASVDGAAAPDAPPGSGHVVYTLGGEAYRIAAVAGSAPEDLGSADWVNVSPDGAHVLLSTTRFGCDGWACVALDGAPLDPVVHAERGAVSPDGNALVFPSTDQTTAGHMEDLVAITRASAQAAWSAPEVLTTSSSHAYHHLPAFSADGATVLFDCGEDAYSVGATSICEVGVDGAGFREVVTPADAPGAGLALHHPDYAPDGSVVFEGDWAGEQIWRRAGTDPPVDVSGGAADDNSPCVLPDGRIASLWLDRPGGPSTHELKLMAADGSAPEMLLTDVDVTDAGISCAP